jgi:fucose 4-O-acetylase-like acetyltransferase
VKDGVGNNLFSIIYSFHMPFFFFLSGYVALKTIKIISLKEIPFFIKNKAISLLIPMLSWPFIRKYFFAKSYNYSISNFSNIPIQEMLNPGLWFLQMLFFIYIIYSFYYLLSKRLNSGSKIGIDVFLLLLTILIFGFIFFSTKNHWILAFLLNYSFFMIGVFLSKFNSIKKLIDNKFLANLILLIFLLISGFYNFKEQDLIIMKLLKVIISISALISFYNIFRKLEIPTLLDKYLCKLGQSSLIIYVTHFSFVSILSSDFLIPKEISFPLLLLILMPISVILITFCLAIGNIISIFPSLNLLLYGVRLKKRLISSLI